MEIGPNVYEANSIELSSHPGNAGLGQIMKHILLSVGAMFLDATHLAGREPGPAGMAASLMSGGWRDCGPHWI